MVLAILIISIAFRAVSELKLRVGNISLSAYMAFVEITGFCLSLADCFFIGLLSAAGRGLRAAVIGIFEACAPAFLLRL